MYDCIILGAGPAGLTAALYAARAGLSALIIEKGTTGGQISQTNDIENYPGQSLEGESGMTLTERMLTQAKSFGAEKKRDTILSAELSGEVKLLHGKKADYQAKTVIICTGARPKLIGCENEEKFIGQGISFCATCDGAFYRNKDVYVVGGGDSAVEEAIFLTRFARKVTVIHRRDTLRAVKSIQTRAFTNPKLDFMWNTVVTKVDGSDLLDTMTVKNTVTGEEKVIHAEADDGNFGLFVFVGLVPNTDLFTDSITTENGYIITDEDMHTNIQGVYAAGDVRKKSLRQVVTATADGAIAAMQANKYIEEKK